MVTLLLQKIMLDKDNTIEVQGARVHNKKYRCFHSSWKTGCVPVWVWEILLAFDTIYAEGQRRYVETFSAYARQFWVV
jgi:excinuclease ABC subunit A